MYYPISFLKDANIWAGTWNATCGIDIENNTARYGGEIPPVPQFPYAVREKDTTLVVSVPYSNIERRIKQAPSMPREFTLKYSGLTTYEKNILLDFYRNAGGKLSSFQFLEIDEFIFDGVETSITVRFDQDSFEFSRVNKNWYDVDIKLVEVW